MVDYNNISREIEQILKEKGFDGIRIGFPVAFRDLCLQKTCDYLNKHLQDMPVPGELVANLILVVLSLVRHSDEFERGWHIILAQDAEIHDKFFGLYCEAIRLALCLGMASVDYRQEIQENLNKALNEMPPDLLWPQ